MKILTQTAPISKEELPNIPFIGVKTAWKETRFRNEY